MIRSLVALSLLISTLSCAGPIYGGDPVPGAWVLTWEDEFDGPAGQAPDPASWSHDVGGDGWGNAQLEFDTDRPDNAALDGAGNLVITARREAYQGRDYTSARIKTAGRFEQAYGRFEARIKLPSGRGIWPAFWLLGADIGEVGWPTCGELDILELRGQEPWVVHGSAHGPGYSGATPMGGKHVLADDATFDQDFHVFAVEWDPARVAWFVDDELYYAMTPSQLPDGARWAYDHPFFILLNVAVGGHFLGPPDAATPFPAAMTVDYVRVYERAR